MEMADYERRQTALQRETSEWLRRSEPNAFVTLTFKTAVSYNEACKAFGTLVHGLKSHFFGRNSKRRLPMVPVIEGATEGQSYAALTTKSDSTHIHCLVRLPGYAMDHKEVFRTAWITAHHACGDPLIYCPNSDGWFLDLDTENKANRLVNYSLKTCAIDTEAVLWKFVSFGQ